MKCRGPPLSPGGVQCLPACLEELEFPSGLDSPTCRVARFSHFYWSMTSVRAALWPRHPKISNLPLFTCTPKVGAIIIYILQKRKLRPEETVDIPKVAVQGVSPGLLTSEPNP